MKRSDQLSDRVAREKHAHTEDDIIQKSQDVKDLFSHIMAYPSLLCLKRKMEGYLESVADLQILDLGCGHGEVSHKLLKRGAKIWGIDISSNYIEKARQSAALKGFSASNYDFQVMDAHNLDFDHNTFDVVVGSGILHHLELEKSLIEIHRVLKPDGQTLFIEPLMDNPLLKLFRSLTPQARTIDEKPLSKNDLKKIELSANWESDLQFCGLTSAPIAVLTSIFLRPYPNNMLLRSSAWFDNALAHVKFLQPMNQYVLLNLVKKAEHPTN